MYIVIFFENGPHFDENTRYFTSWSAAFDYCQKLNLELAKENHCRVKDLGDYYDIEEVKKGK